MVICPACCDISLYSSYLHPVAVGQPLSLLYSFKSPHSSSPHRHVDISSAGPLHGGATPTPSRLYRHLSGDRSDCPDRAVQHSSVYPLSIRPSILYQCFSCTLESIQAALGWRWPCSLDRLAVYRRVNADRQTRDNTNNPQQSSVIQTSV